MGGCLSKTDAAGVKRWSITGKTIRQSLDNFALDHVPLAMTPGNFHDKYRVGVILGTGAYSTVFAATAISGGEDSGGGGGGGGGGDGGGEDSGGSGEGSPEVSDIYIVQYAGGPPKDINSGAKKRGASKLFEPASPAASEEEAAVVKWDPDAAAEPDGSARSVAVKRVEQKNMTTHHHAALRREVTIMADCAHPNVLSVSSSARWPPRETAEHIASSTGIPTHSPTLPPAPHLYSLRAVHRYLRRFFVLLHRDGGGTRW